MKKYLQKFCAMSSSKKLLLLAVFAVVCLGVSAQVPNLADGKTALDTINTSIRTYIPTIRLIVYLAIGVIGLVYIVQAAQKFIAKEQDATKSLALAIFGIIVGVGLVEFIIAVLNLG